jgi:hypothetical protein
MVVPTSIIVNINNGLAGSIRVNTHSSRYFSVKRLYKKTTKIGFFLVVFLVQALSYMFDSITIITILC